MNYEIFLLDSSNHIKLDCESIDMATTFSVADIKDLAARKDSITKKIVFKGTKTNNQAFGSMFHLNKVSDSSLSNKLFFNYNPLRTVDCLVYEGGMILLKGNLRVLEVVVNKGTINYSTVITGKFIEFKSIIQEKMLGDLDMSDLKHRYTKDNIQKSWDTSIEVFNPSTSTYSTVPFSKGNGYIYPYIDYGTKFMIADNNVTNSDESKFHALNFRPAVYAKEYIKKIFSQPELNGWSYEVKGSPEFQDKFNSLIIPHSEAEFQHTYSGFNLAFQKPAAFTQTQSTSDYSWNKVRNLLNISQANSISINPFIIVQPGFTNVLLVKRFVTTDALITINISNFVNPYNRQLKVKGQLVERTLSSDFIHNGWESVAEVEFDVLPSETITSKTLNINIGERTYQQGKTLAVRLLIEHPFIFGGTTPIYATGITYTIDSVIASFPKDTSTTFKTNVQHSLSGNPDEVSPVPPANIKQFDFLKSIMSLMNLYAYTDKMNPKQLILQKYDDYYALTGHEVIKTTALNWTNKIDSDNFKIISNLTLPKNYIFTYKDDNDWINADYKKKHNKTFGSFTFTDALGVVDSKKVELIFSPTPLITPVGTRRIFPALYTLESENKKAIKTNIRILYYNGLKPCAEYTILSDVLTDGSWTTNELFHSTQQYPQVSTYFYDETGKPIEDLNFGRSNEYYISINEDYLNVSHAYSTYYSNQITEITNINVFTVEADVFLNEIDITNLDLRVPVFIDLGTLGYSYFKVLSVEYYDNKSKSKVLLQKIFLGLNS